METFLGESVTPIHSRGATGRRRVDRIPLAVPLHASMNRQEVTILNLSLSGARIRHSRALGLGESRLRFASDDASFDEFVHLVSTETISIAGPMAFDSRVRFHASNDQSSAALSSAMAS